MRQLSKKEILEIPHGGWRGHIRLSLIPEERGEPKVFMSNHWPLKFDKIGNLTLITVLNLTWETYILERNCSDSGDLVCEDYLLQLYTL